MPLDASYVALKNQVIKAERNILKVLGFVVHVNHPHKLIYAYLHSIKAINNPELVQKAWNYMNDSLRTDVFLRYRPETIACACIFLAARTIPDAVPLPEEPFHWFELYDASDRDVDQIARILLALYTRTRPPSWNQLAATLNCLRNPAGSNSTVVAAGNGTLGGQQAPSATGNNDEKARKGSKKRDESARPNGNYRERSPINDIPRRYKSPSRDRKRDRSDYGDGESGRSGGKHRHKHHRERDRKDRDETRNKHYSRDRMDSSKKREREVYQTLGKHHSRVPSVSPDRRKVSKR